MEERQRIEDFLQRKREDARQESEKFANMLTVLRRETFGTLKALTRYTELLSLIDPNDPPGPEVWIEMEYALDQIAGNGGTGCLAEELEDLKGRAKAVRHAIEWTDGRRVDQTGPNTYTLHPEPVEDGQ